MLLGKRTFESVWLTHRKMVAEGSEKVEKPPRKKKRVKQKTSLFHWVNLSSTYTAVTAGSSAALPQTGLVE